jgi:hypothetical protein
MHNAIPIVGCAGCSGSGGTMGCPIHGNNIYLPSTYYYPSIIPYKCPVCNGNGKMTHGIYGEMWAQCHACNGTGIIWGLN